MPITTTGLILAGVGAATKGIGMIQANKDKKKAQRELGELQKTPFARYSATPEMQNYYGKVLGGVNNPMGMTAAEKASAQSGINTAQNTQMYNVAGTSGGNLSRYISGAINNQGVQANNQLAMRDAQMRQQNYNQNLGLLGGASSQMQNISNRNTDQELSRRMMLEQGLGGAVLQNKRFMQESLGSIGSDLIGGGLMMGMSGMGGGGTSGGTKTIPFAGARNSLVGKNTSTVVDPSLLKTDPLANARNTRNSLNLYSKSGLNPMFD
jgi:hypothetical protein